MITNNDVTAARVQNVSGFDILIKATVGAVAPTDTLGAVNFKPGQIIAADLTLAQVWPGIAGTRLYALCDQNAVLSVSHA
jgi:hypothetical protein